MKPDDIPQWAWDEAETLFEDIGYAIGGCGCDDCREKWVPACARALLEAHHRGRREGMEEAAKIAKAHDKEPIGSLGIARSIRAKMEEQP